MSRAALLALMRFSQGLGLGGEWSGAALLATETAEKGKRAWAAMWPQLGAPLGFLLANGLMLILVSVMDYTKGDKHGTFLDWGWRIPFVLSAVMIAIGLYVRLKLTETPVFRKAVDEGRKVDAPLKEVVTTAWRPLILGTFVMLSTYTIFYLVTTWVLSYGIGKPSAGGLGIPYSTFLGIQVLTVLFFVAGVPISGYLADRVGRRRMLMAATTAVIVYGLCFGPLLAGGGTARMAVFLSVGMALMGLTFGPMSAVLPEMFATNVRYTGSGISYNVSSILGAAVAPFIATYLVSTFHSVVPVGLYLSAMGVISFVALILMRETRHDDLTEVG